MSWRFGRKSGSAIVPAGVADALAQAKYPSCQHEPDYGLRGEKRVINHTKRIEYGAYCDYAIPPFREIVTEEVCRYCSVRYVTRYRVDEVSAEVGPIVKPGPEAPEVTP
jgi:hypothetical protein